MLGGQINFRFFDHANKKPDMMHQLFCLVFTRGVCIWEEGDVTMIEGSRSGSECLSMSVGCNSFNVKQHDVVPPHMYMTGIYCPNATKRVRCDECQKVWSWTHPLTRYSNFVPIGPDPL